MKIRPAHIALAGFILFLVTLIILADSGHGQRLFALAARLPGGDKLGHFVLFGGLSFLVNLITRAAMTRLFGRRVLKGSAIIMAVVTLEECSQLFFRTRSFDLVDLASDALGIWVCGRLAFHYLNWRRARTLAPVTLPRD